MSVGAGGAGGGVAAVPSEAPSVVWVIVLTAAALWWIWPWLAKLRGDPACEAAVLGAAPKQVGGFRLPHVPLASAEDRLPDTAAAAEGPGGRSEHSDIVESGAGRLASDLSFELPAEFRQAFADAASYLGQALAGPPTGEAYVAAVTAVKKLAEILDRLFSAFGSSEDLAKVSCLREGGEAFRRDFGAHRVGDAMRGLLRTAGFERQEPGASGSGGAVWVFPHEDALARLRGLTVRLCLGKSAELQKARGPGRFLHTDNSAVIPKVEDATFAELVDLYRGRGSLSIAPAELKSSMRERSFEASVRVKLNKRREERGSEALSLHEGLAGIARVLADAQRTRARKDSDDLYPTSKIAEEVRTQLARLPLPPGFSVAHLHWSSTELPRLFGMASTRGGSSGKDSGGLGTSNAKDAGEGDTAAEIMSNEAVGYWAARQQRDVFWPAAAICGVGAALDYTVNKGFAVALIVGYEAPRPADDGLQSDANELRRRPAAAAGPERKRPVEPPKFTPANSHKPRITGFRDLSKPKAGG